MKSLPNLFEKNKQWSEQMEASDPGFFERLAKQQTPKYLWIGCADSRVPANQITGLNPGEVFVHRNIANVVGQTDLNMLSVVQYAVEVLKVEHVIVCGHYGCGGVAASVDGQKHGLVDNWIRAIGNVAEAHEDELNALEGDLRLERLCELNVLAQARNVSKTTVLQDAWSRGQKVDVHPWIYRLNTGRLRGLADPIKR
ncbi:carbonate dehydratase [Akkermansiaceae bacterium]|nr:carbonate dehydratase [Akkermansiaceae bacterium]MDA7932160.1 carbonate dehydratase [Akkermansiaceae bacterium]MDB4313707.1 carbonate dehydratase [Akkermansiaceae bacterium]MDB4377745.1 carbonate dehydratase [Akkermansiaceae bacterium]MDB4578476.1 carbonate dehydratase [Akkermansiaceae bacterium]